MDMRTRLGAVVVASVAVVLLLGVVLGRDAAGPRLDLGVWLGARARSSPTAEPAASAAALDQPNAVRGGVAEIPPYSPAPFRLEYEKTCNYATYAGLSPTKGTVAFEDRQHTYFREVLPTGAEKYFVRKGERYEYVAIEPDIERRPSNSQVTVGVFRQQVPEIVRERASLPYPPAEMRGLGTEFLVPVVTHAELAARLRRGAYTYVGDEFVLGHPTVVVDIPGRSLGREISYSKHRAWIAVDSGATVKYAKFDSDGEQRCTTVATAMEVGPTFIADMAVPHPAQLPVLELRVEDALRTTVSQRPQAEVLRAVPDAVRAGGGTVLTGTYMVGNNYVDAEDWQEMDGRPLPWRDFGTDTWGAVYEIELEDGQRALVIAGEPGVSLPFYFEYWPGESGDIVEPPWAQVSKADRAGEYRIALSDPRSWNQLHHEGYDRVTTWVARNGARLMVLWNSASRETVMGLVDALMLGIR